MSRRWNGWGEDGARAEVPESARDLLQGRLGPGTRNSDARLEALAGAVPPSRLAPHPLVSTSAAERVTVARGQGFPDLIALRTGRFAALPDGVARPSSREEVRALLAFAQQAGAQVIPYGGGTSVAGQVTTQPAAAPTLVLSLERMTRLLALEPRDRLATFGAGIPGPLLEAHLRAHGWTLGHFPQSFELSTLGGWVATRSRGQQSLGYGRIEEMFAGGHLEAPAGTVEVPPHPASSTGPDVREWLLGSEGRLGILTDVTVRIRAVPEREVFRAFAFRDLERARECVAALAAEGLAFSMLRLMTPGETEVSLAVAGKGRSAAWMEALLSLRGLKLPQGSLLIAGLTGRRAAVRLGWRGLRRIARKGGAIGIPGLGSAWARGRFRAPYLRDALWDLGYGVDTVETATNWSGHAALQAAVEAALGSVLEAEGERVLVFSHLSHVYPTGANLYTTFVFRLCPDPDQTLARWRRLKDAASRAIVASGGTISHQHGVGVDHRPYLEAEKGALAVDALRRLAARFDPERVMNPGKLFEDRA
ncbi:MAG TPA: FAD-binding oxidoreductase [Myxococcales bacterium]|nr:FAD-binding oxidoreductase [Myxococcales bacterium]